MIGLEALRDRLIVQIRRRIQNGEATERSLALRAEISQPHLHNMLKGVRSLNPAMGDQLLVKLGLSVLDLFDSDELRRALFLRARENEPSVEVPVLQDRLGPGLPWPNQFSPFELVKVPLRISSHIPQPRVARLADDPAMAPYLTAGELTLLDSSTRGLANEDPEALFVTQCGNSIAIRWIRRGRGRLYLVRADCRNRPREWEVVGSVMIRARAIPLRSIHEPELVYDPLLPRDKPRAPAPQSGAS
jgi:hypothetical protein